MKTLTKLLTSFASIIMLLSGIVYASDDKVENYPIPVSASFQKLQEARSNLIWPGGKPKTDVQFSNHPFVKEYGISKVDQAACQSYVDCILSIAGADGLSDKEEMVLLTLIKRSKLNEMLPQGEFQPVMEYVQNAIQKARISGYKGVDVTNFAKLHSKNIKVLLGEDAENIEKATAVAMLCDAMLIASADGLTDEEVEPAREVAKILDVSKEFELIKKYSILATQLADIENQVELFYTEVLSNK
jgi:tellurite resistance protein